MRIILTILLFCTTTAQAQVRGPSLGWFDVGDAFRYRLQNQFSFPSGVVSHGHTRPTVTLNGDATSVDSYSTAGSGAVHFGDTVSEVVNWARPFTVVIVGTRGATHRGLFKYATVGENNREFYFQISANKLMCGEFDDLAGANSADWTGTFDTTTHGKYWTFYSFRYSSSGAMSTRVTLRFGRANDTIATYRAYGTPVGVYTRGTAKTTTLGAIGSDGVREFSTIGATAFVLIFDRVLTDKEIDNIYEKHLTITPDTY
jgi:hypothetical protein